MRTAFRLIAVVCLASVLIGQDGPSVNSSQGPPMRAWQKQFFYDASNNLEYICYAPSSPAVTTWARSDSSLTNIVDSTNTSTVTTAAAHGLSIGSTVIITGSTAETDLNGTYSVLTVPTTATFTITTANVTDATYTVSTLAVAYTGTLDTDGTWSIQKFFYNASNLTFKVAWASGNPAADKACASRATYQYR